MKALVLGADGYLGWPTAMALSEAGYEVIAIDNLSKRKILKEQKIKSLNSPSDFLGKCKTWSDTNGPIIGIDCDLAELGSLEKIMNEVSTLIKELKKGIE